MNAVEKFLSEQPSMLQKALDEVQDQNTPRGLTVEEMLDCMNKILIGNLLSWLGLAKQLHEAIKVEDEELAGSLAQDLGAMITFALTKILPVELPKEVMAAHKRQMIESIVRKMEDKNVH